jgi:hypothetical protein
VSVVATDGTVTDGPDSKAYIAGLTIIDVPSREEAVQWAAKKSPSPAAVLKRSASSGPTRPSATDRASRPCRLSRADA